MNGSSDQPTNSAFRIGSVPYLNSLPLTCGIEPITRFAPPSQLAELLRAGAVDAALVSVTEVLFTGGYDLLDGVAIGSDGCVGSVVLAHRGPLREVKLIHCDRASLTSVTLLKVLLAENGAQAKLVPLADYGAAPDCDAVLLIGDRALDFVLSRPAHTIWDLGDAWRSLTGLPFVYAAWALRKGGHRAADRELLRAAKRRGLAELERLIAAWPAYSLEFRRRYLTENVRFDLGPAEKRGLARFAELITRHGLGPVHPIHYVE
jgi:predicted solute-binding protein